MMPTTTQDGPLVADGIGFTIGGARLLEQIGLSFPAGDFTALIGPNGAGKTTLLRILAGDLTPTAGEVSFLGKELATYNRLELARSRAVLPQSSALSFPLSVEEVIAMGRGPFGETQSEVGQAVRQAMRETDILSLAGRDYLTLSGGERQRVHLARVWTQVRGMPSERPRILFLDEPTNHLDLAHRRQILQSAKALTEDGVTVIAVLHDFNEVLDYAEHVAVLNHGCRVAWGQAEQVMQPKILDPVFSVNLQEAYLPSGKRRLWPE